MSVSFDGSNRLIDLAERVRETSAAADTAAIVMAGKAIETGRLLLEAKAACAHGHWLPFLTAAGLAERKAQRYMTLAKTYSKADTVSDLGGIKAALDLAAVARLPKPGEFLSASLDDWAGARDSLIAMAWSDEGGLFHVAVHTNKGLRKTEDPIAAWCVLETMNEGLDGRIAEASFQLVPETVTELDPAFLASLAATPIPALDDLPAIQAAPLPAVYVAAKEALEACERSFSQEGYDTAMLAVRECLASMHVWPKGSQMIGTYARIAKDDLPGLVDRVNFQRPHE